MDTLIWLSIEHIPNFDFIMCFKSKLLIKTHKSEDIQSISRNKLTAIYINKNTVQYVCLVKN